MNNWLEKPKDKNLALLYPKSLIIRQVKIASFQKSQLVLRKKGLFYSQVFGSYLCTC